MNNKIENSLNLLLDTAKKLGAESATVVGNENTSVSVSVENLVSPLVNFKKNTRSNALNLLKLKSI